MRERGGSSAGLPRSRRAADWWLRDRSTGRITLLQWPNPALGVWVIAVVASRFAWFPDRAEEIRWIGVGALIAWAADELLRGVTPARRLLGLVVLSWQLYELIR